MYGADWLRKAAVGESGAGSGFGKDASCWTPEYEGSGIEEDVGTGAAVAYARNDRGSRRGVAESACLLRRRTAINRDMLRVEMAGEKKKINSTVTMRSSLCHKFRCWRQDKGVLRFSTPKNSPISCMTPKFLSIARMPQFSKGQLNDIGAETVDTTAPIHDSYQQNNLDVKSKEGS